MIRTAQGEQQNHLQLCTDQLRLILTVMADILSKVADSLYAGSLNDMRYGCEIPWLLRWLNQCISAAEAYWTTRQAGSYPAHLFEQSIWRLNVPVALEGSPILSHAAIDNASLKVTSGVLTSLQVAHNDLWNFGFNGLSTLWSLPVWTFRYSGSADTLWRKNFIDLRIIAGVINGSVLKYQYVPCLKCFDGVVQSCLRIFRIPIIRWLLLLSTSWNEARIFMPQQAIQQFDVLGKLHCYMTFCNTVRIFHKWLINANVYAYSGHACDMASLGVVIACWDWQF